MLSLRLTHVAESPLPPPESRPRKKQRTELQDMSDLFLPPITQSRRSARLRARPVSSVPQLDDDMNPDLPPVKTSPSTQAFPWAEATTGFAQREPSAMVSSYLLPYDSLIYFQVTRKMTIQGFFFVPKEKPKAAEVLRQHLGFNERQHLTFFLNRLEQTMMTKVGDLSISTLRISLAARHILNLACHHLLKEYAPLPSFSC